MEMPNGSGPVQPRQIGIHWHRQIMPVAFPGFASRGGYHIGREARARDVGEWRLYPIIENGRQTVSEQYRSVSEGNRRDGSTDHDEALRSIWNSGRMRFPVIADLGSRSPQRQYSIAVALK
jgi:hypothetical protein